MIENGSRTSLPPLPYWARRLAGRGETRGVCAPPKPPRAPGRSEIGAPDFVGIGAQRAGTTRWFELIAAHPEVTPPPSTKELHFFDRFYAGGFEPRHVEEYRRHFPRPAGQVSGEWTPLYMAAPWVPPLLAQCAPRAKLLVLLRDPLERYRSGLQHDAKLARRRREPLSELAPLEAFARGLYHAQLRALLEHFARSQVLVLQYERCAREPRAELMRTYRFLGLDTGFGPDLDAHPHRQPHKPALDDRLREALASAYAEDVARLAEDFPEIDLELWPSFARGAPEPANVSFRARPSLLG